jgi:type VI secretion system protein ImpH
MSRAYLPGAAGWRRPSPVASWLFREPWAFDFFQAVRLLTMLRPNAAPPGEGSSAEQEAVRFRSRISLEFAPADIHTLRPPRVPGGAPELVANFLALGGPDGPLPWPDTELLIARIRARDHAMSEFLDIFHHRLLSIFTRIRRAHHPTFVLTQAESSPTGQHVLSLIGLGPASLRRRLEVRDQSLMYYAGLVSHQPRSASGLACLLTDFLRLPVQVMQFAGSWRHLEEHQWSRIGVRLGSNQALGTAATLGTRYFDQERGIEMRIGPLSLPEFLDILPPGSAWKPMGELARFYTGRRCRIQIRPILRAAEVPRARLGGDTRLGWTSWVITKPPQQNAAQVRLTVEGAEV